MIMKKPEIDVIRFECSDIVAASSGIKTLTWTGLGDSNAYNNVISFNGQSYTITNGTVATNMRKDLADYFEDQSIASGTNGTVSFDNYKLNEFAGSNTVRSDADGTYIYSGNKRFTKKA